MVYSSIFRSQTKSFKDRAEAGDRLAGKLTKYKQEDSIVLGLPRGGVPVAYRVSKKLNAPLSVLVSRKIGAPGHEEFGLGAISEEDSLYLDKGSLSKLNLDRSDLTQTIDNEKAELRRRVQVYRDGKSLPSLKNKTVILVDDGLATGGTAKAALKALNRLGAKKVVFAVPVCAKQSVEDIKEDVDEVICLLSPANLQAIGLYYDDFGQTLDEEVVNLLRKADRLAAERN